MIHDDDTDPATSTASNDAWAVRLTGTLDLDVPQPDRLQVGPSATRATSLGTASSGSDGFAFTAASAAQSDVYTAHQRSILDDLDLTDLVAKDMRAGPQIAGGAWSQEAQDAADFVLAQHGQTLASRSVYDTVQQRINVRSSGVWVGDETTTTIDVEAMTRWSYYRPATNTRSTDYWLHTGFDASDATGEVTFNGYSRSTWYSLANQNYELNIGGDMSTILAGSKKSVHYDYGNVFKGGDYGNIVTGSIGSDTLIGGQGDDKIDGVAGRNLIYGVAGDNVIHGGDDGSTIFGGTGNDFIRTGTGDNTVILSSGNNWVVVDQNKVDGSSDPNTIISGSGSDTFVIGNIPPAETTTVSTLDEWSTGLTTDIALDTAQGIVTAGIEFLGYTNPMWGIMATAGFDVISALVGGKPSDRVTVTEYPVFKETVIHNFNPLTDRLVLPMNADGGINLSVRDRTTDGTDHDIEIYDNATGKPLAFLELASKAEIFGTTGDLSLTEKTGFADSILSSLFIMDADGVQYGGESLIPSAEAGTPDILPDLSDLGAGRYMFGGAWNGVMMFGNATGNLYMGSNHDDVLYGFDIYTNIPAPEQSKGQTFYGFAGNNVYAPGAGPNTVVGGADYDTVSYAYSIDGIAVDMTTTFVNLAAPHVGAYYKVDNGFGTVDKLYSVEGIVGSAFDDVIVGSEADNTFYSTGGDNVWTGTAGANTFHLNGGTTRITDYSSENDTITVVRSQDIYSAGNKLRWLEADESWTLYDTGNEQAIVVLDKTEAFTGAAEIEMLREDGTTRVFTPKTAALDNFGYDLAA